MDDGTYRDGAKTVTINDDGNAVDSEGNIIARGVTLDILVMDNVVIMKDEPIKTLFAKYDEKGNALEGGSYSICTVDGRVVKAVKDTAIPSLAHDGMILKGEDLTFSVKENGSAH